MKNLFFTLSVLVTSWSFSQMVPDKYADMLNEMQGLSSESSLKKIKKAIKDEPNDPWYYWIAADIYERMGDKANVVKSYEKSIVLDSNFAAGHGSYARFLRNEENVNFKKALYHINKALSLDKIEFYYHIDKGEIYLLMKEYNLAMDEANFVLLEQPDHGSTALELIVKILHHEGKKSELIKFVLKNELSDYCTFWSTEVVLIVGDLYTELGEAEKACICFNNAQEPYEMSGSPIPETLSTRLKKCK